MLTIPRLRRGARNLASLALALGAVGEALHGLPLPEVPQVTPKLALLAAERERCSAIFLGSSRVNNGLVPEVFDATVGGRSFNFGIDGMSYPESGYVGDEILAMHGKAPRWMFIEMGINLALWQDGRTTLRAIYWHDLPRTAQVLRRLGAVKATPATFDFVKLHLRMAALRLVNVGYGAEHIRQRTGHAFAPGPRDRFAPAARGYLPIEGAMLAEERAAFARDAARMPDPALPNAERVSGALLLDFARRLEARGVTPVFFTTPNTSPTPDFFRGFAGKLPMVLRFDRPAAYPALYDPAERQDAMHFNDAGARRFTRALAEEFARRLDAER